MKKKSRKIMVSSLSAPEMKVSTIWRFFFSIFSLFFVEIQLRTTILSKNSDNVGQLVYGGRFSYVGAGTKF